MGRAAFGPMDGADGADGADSATGFVNLDALGTGSTPAFRPVGAVPEFQRRAGEDDYRSHRWPPVLPNHAWPPNPPNPNSWPIATPNFKPRLTDFSPDNASFLVLADLVKGNAWTTLMTRDANNPANDDMAQDIAASGGLKEELAELRLLAQFRSGAMAEALAQRNGIIGYFRALLYFSVTTNPYTYYIVGAALRLGEFLCIYYKNIFQRTRAIRIDPSLLGPIDPPGHPSYPSGHSLQSFLIARCLEQIVPAAIGTDPNTGVVAKDQSPFWLLAEQIAKLREVLGLHYPSDTRAGRRVADKAFPLMMACPTICGTPVVDINNNVTNQLKDVSNAPVTIAGQQMYDNGWFAAARQEWVPM